jgi:hypothetical protein
MTWVFMTNIFFLFIFPPFYICALYTPIFQLSMIR